MERRNDLHALANPSAAMQTSLLKKLLPAAMVFCVTAASAQINMERIRQQWRAQNYREVIAPLKDYLGSLDDDSRAFEPDYMMATSLTNLADHLSEGCRYFLAMVHLYDRRQQYPVAGSYVTIQWAMQDKCPQELASLDPPPPQPGVSVAPMIISVKRKEVLKGVKTSTEPSDIEGDHGNQCNGMHCLTLINGWNNAPFATSIATVEEVSGIVQFRGAIASGSTAQPFVMPVGFRPATDVYVPVDLCNATNGRLHITPSGTVDIQAENGAFANAQCFTSLDGVSFAPSATGFTQLTLINGWTNAPFSTSNAAVAKVNGIFHFKGAIASGSNAQPFVMPVGFRPATDVYVPVDLCNASNGRLHITPSGTVDIQTEGGKFANAQCFTSLDGAWFTPLTVTNLTLINGWTNAPFNTSPAAAGKMAFGLVYFRGAIASGSNAPPFTLPVAFRPVTDVYVPVDLCNATNGRLHITPSGTVDIQAENGAFSNAQCFTSLDGVSFVR